MAELDAAEMSDRLFAQSLAMTEVAAVWLGQRLGWYAALHEHGPMTQERLAAATDTDPRCAREWLEQQAVAGVIVRDGESYALPPGPAEALLDRDSERWAGPLVRQMVAAVLRLPELEGAYRSGAGHSWEDFGPEMSAAQGDINRPALLHTLPELWVPQIPELAARLVAGARVADICCGHGWAAIGLAVAFPGITVDGYDMDRAALAAAERNAELHGVADRVRFHFADVSRPLPAGGYDVAVAVECVHDLARPVAVLQAIRAATAENGMVIVIDMAADDALRTPADDIQRTLYGFSLLVCLPDSMAQPDSAATGAVMRLSTLIDYATAAGFGAVTVLDVPETGLWRIYRLDRPA